MGEILRHKTEKTIQLISELLSKGPKSELLKQFGFRECGAIPNFFSMCLNWKDDDAWNHLNEWTKHIPVENLAWLDCAFRLRSFMPGFAQSKFDPEAPFMVQCLMTFHSCGKQREKALRALGENNSGAELPFILLRLNDWVKPIQSLAKSLIRERMRKEFYAQYFLRDVFLVDRLKDCWRWLHEEILDDMYCFIAKGNPKGILNVIRNSNRHASFAAFNLYEKVFPEDSRSLVLASLKSPHSGLHLKCSSKIHDLDDEYFKETLSFFLSSKPPLRVAAIRSFCERFPEEKIKFLESMLMNPSAYVREVVVWILKKEHDGFDPAEYYRNISTAQRSISVVKAIGQFGDSSDSLFLKNVLKKENSPKLKKAALESLSILEDKDIKDILYSYIHVDGYSKTVRKLLSKRINSADKDKLFELYSDANELTRINVKKLMFYLPDTEHGFLLMQLSLKFEEFREKLCSFLCTSNFYCTSQKNKKRMIQQFESNQHLFSAKQKDSLELSFKYWGV